MGTSGTNMPYTFIVDGEYQGIDIEIITEFCKYAGYRLEILQMPFGSLLTSLQVDKIDVIANQLFITNDRAKVLNYSLPYSRSLSDFEKSYKFLTFG